MNFIAPEGCVNPDHCKIHGCAKESQAYQEIEALSNGQYDEYLRTHSSDPALSIAIFLSQMCHISPAFRELSFELREYYKRNDKLLEELGNR